MNLKYRHSWLIVVCLVAAGCGGAPAPTPVAPQVTEPTPIPARIDEATPIPTPTAPVHEPGSIAIESVQVTAKGITCTGSSAPAEGVCVLTQLEVNGAAQSWWPATRCAKVSGDIWQIEVGLGQEGAPAALDPTVEYVLRAWQQQDPAVEARFPFDLAGPPLAAGSTTHISQRYGVVLEHPASWARVEGYDERIGGAEGFLQLNALEGEGWSLDEACNAEAQHNLQPYGSSPHLESWPGLAGDGCLILPSDDQPAEMQGQAELIVAYPEPVRIDDTTYNYLLLYGDQATIRQTMTSLRFVPSPGPAEREPALAWEGEALDGTCQHLDLWANGLAAAGGCGQAVQPVPYFGHRQYLALWPDWRERFAAFEADTPTGQVVFRGRGTEAATPSWQRALGSWASLVCSELQSGRSGASWGTALAGHWQISEETEYCQFLQVETYGYAYASVARCGGGDAYDLGEGWLEPAEWDRFDEWLYAQAAVSRPEIDFFGAGQQEMSAGDQAALVSWAEAVTTRLAQGIPVPLPESDLQAWSSASPGGEWIAQGLMIGPFLVGEDQQYRTLLQVSRVDGTASWTIVDETAHFGLGYTVPSPLHWSADGRYLYFTNMPVPDGCAVFVNGSDLQRVSLDDGSVSPVLEGGAWWLSLSPDESTLAYTRWNGETLELVLHDMAGAEERQVAVDRLFTQGGSIIWSPDGTSLAVTLAANPCDPDRWQQAIVLVQADTLEQTTLLAADSWLRQTIEWPQPGTILLSDKEGRFWCLDVESGELLRTTADGTPLPAAGPESLQGLVFSTDDGLWQIDSQGSPALLLPEPGALISPDGRLAIIATEQEIQVVELASGRRRVLRSPPGYNVFRQPRWANTDRILFGAFEEGSEPGPSLGHLTAASADGSWVQLLDIESVSNALPAASPDGELVAYDRAGTAWLRPWLGDPQALDPVAFGLPEAKDLRMACPAWSPDGGRLAWVVGGTFEDGWRIGVAVLDLHSQTSQLLHLYEPVGVGGWPDAPVWSPDGQWLAYVVWPAADPAQGGLWVMRPGGEEERRLGQGAGPVWSSDGQRLVSTEQLSDGQTAVWLAEAGVWEPQPLELPAGAIVQAWTPGT